MPTPAPVVVPPEPECPAPPADAVGPRPPRAGREPGGDVAGDRRHPDRRIGRLHPDTLREVEAIARLGETQINLDNPRANPLNTNTSVRHSSAASAKAFLSSPGHPAHRAPPDPSHPGAEGIHPAAQAANASPPGSTGSPPATCHMPLYFQDAVLERYGQGAEQALGPAGRSSRIRWTTPRRSNQPTHLAQPTIRPACSRPVRRLARQHGPGPALGGGIGPRLPPAGRPRPPNTYYFPLTGVGPPLHGNDYGKPKPRKGWSPRRSYRTDREKRCQEPFLYKMLVLGSQSGEKRITKKTVSGTVS